MSPIGLCVWAPGPQLVVVVGEVVRLEWRKYSTGHKVWELLASSHFQFTFSASCLRWKYHLSASCCLLPCLHTVTDSDLSGSTNQNKPSWPWILSQQRKSNENQYNNPISTKASGVQVNSRNLSKILPVVVVCTYKSVEWMNLKSIILTKI